MKRWTVSAALEGIGAALLLLFPYILPWVSPSNLALYPYRLPVTNLVGGLLVDLLGFAVMATGFLVAVHYLPGTLQRTLNALFAGFILWRIVDIAIAMQTDLQLTAYWSGVRRLSFITIFPISILLALFLPRVTQPAARTVRLVIAGFAFCALWMIPQLLHLALVRKPVQSAASNRPSALESSGSNKRIVWILFDELSYHQTFDHPAPGLKLPNFDQLRDGSVSFSNVKQSGFYTDRIIPSLFLGRQVDRVRSTIGGDLWYEDESQNRWLAYDPKKTLFGLAQSKGWSSGVDEWTFPYCRVLASVLDVCSWESSIMSPMESYGASEEKSVLANAAVLPRAFLASGTDHSHSAQNTNIREYHDILAHAVTLIGDNQVRFVFLHFPVPHPPGIYDRQRHILRLGGTYLDNLVLADDTLGLLLQKIDSAPSSSQTTVIVSSDHSWRIPIWRHAEFWSDEEERASGGRFDDRPVLLIHFGDQKLSSDVSAPLPELLEHDIIAGMLCGKINNPEDLAVFLAQSRR
jgi:hypothetical protein